MWVERKGDRLLIGSKDGDDFDVIASIHEDDFYAIFGMSFERDKPEKGCRVGVKTVIFL